MSVDFDRMAANLPADQRKQLSREYRRGAKNDTAAFLSCFFLGIFGIHHMYLGEWGRGLAHLIIPVLAAVAVVVGILGDLPSLSVALVVLVLLLAALIWEIVELFQIDGKVHQHNLRLAESLIGAGALADSSTLVEAVARLDNAMTDASAIGTITLEDVLAAREMAGDYHNAIMEEFDSTTTKYISDDPNATTPGASVTWTESGPYEPLAATNEADAAEASASDTLDMPVPEYVTHTHTETADSVTDSYEFDRVPDATQPPESPTPTSGESEAVTWPDHPPLEEPVAPSGESPADADIPLTALAAGAGAMALGATLAEGEDAGEATEAPPDAMLAGAGGPESVDEAHVAGIASTAGIAEEPVIQMSGPDVTDHHAQVPAAQPIADVEGAGATPHYVMLPDDAPVADLAGAAPAAESAPPMPPGEPISPATDVPVAMNVPPATEDVPLAAAEDVAVAMEAPLIVDTSTLAHDVTDAHPQMRPAGAVADVEVNPAQPVYVSLPDEAPVSSGESPADLPGETYVPPVVPQPPAGDAAGVEVASAGAVLAGAAYAASHADAPQTAPEAAPTSGPLMKRIRMKRQIVVDGQVVREEVVEKLVPVETDTKALVAELDTQLGHASKEEIARLAHLDPDASFELRHRFDSAPLNQEQSAD